MALGLLTSLAAFSTSPGLLGYSLVRPLSASLAKAEACSFVRVKDFLPRDMGASSAGRRGTLAGAATPTTSNTRASARFMGVSLRFGWFWSAAACRRFGFFGWVALRLRLLHTHATLQRADAFPHPNTFQAKPKRWP